MEKAELLKTVQELISTAFDEGYKRGKQEALTSTLAHIDRLAECLKVVQAPDGHYYMGGERISK